MGLAFRKSGSIRSSPLREWRRFHVAWSLAVAASGCVTAPIPPERTIDVPVGLSEPDVRDAVVASVTSPTRRDLTPAERIADRALAALVWGYRTIDRPQTEWFPESVAPGGVMAGCRFKTHYVRVVLRFDEHSVRYRIADSRNLRQSQERIHENVIPWLDDLDLRIRRALGYVSSNRQIGAANRSGTSRRFER